MHNNEMHTRSKQANAKIRRLLADRSAQLEESKRQVRELVRQVANLERQNDRLRGQLVEATEHWPDLLCLDDRYTLTEDASHADRVSARDAAR